MALPKCLIYGLQGDAHFLQFKNNFGLLIVSQEIPELFTTKKLAAAEPRGGCLSIENLKRCLHKKHIP